MDKFVATSENEKAEFTELINDFAAANPYTGKFYLRI